jgi:4-amino-4-deoxy-L-arabinose transferase-like glycosyltransferase
VTERCGNPRGATVEWQGILTQSNEDFVTGSADQVEPISRAEVGWLALVTVLAGLLRFVGLPADGISHFDEGVYVLWGTGSGYPFREFFAPPLYPLLVRGVAKVVGSSDFVAQFVSAILGTATVPLVWWVARRWYGRVAASATVPLVAFSGMHVAFSRMALTDACFLFLFVLAMWLVSESIHCAFHVKLDQGTGRSRTNVFRGFTWAIAAGIAAGGAMNTKYNGWLVVVFAAGCLAVLAASPRGRKVVVWRQAAACIALVAVMAGILYLPWFVRVHSSYGYERLLAHHRGYVTGWATWPANLTTLFLEQRAFSDFTGALAPALGMVAAIAVAGRTLVRPMVSATVAGVAVAGFVLGDAIGWFVGPILAIWLVRTSRPAMILHLVWLFGLTVLTPLYQPYPRLLLPLVAAGWLAMGFVLAKVVALWSEACATPGGWFDGRLTSVGIAAVAAAVLWMARSEDHQLGNGRPSSLKAACERLHDAIAVDRHVAFLVRPPVLVYVEWRPHFELLDPAGIDRWLGDQPITGGPRFLLVDMALVRDNPAARDLLQSASDRLHELMRVQYQPGLSVRLDDFGRAVPLAEADPRLAETYALALYRVEVPADSPSADRR